MIRADHKYKVLQWQWTTEMGRSYHKCKWKNNLLWLALKALSKQYLQVFTIVQIL
jgi:hypothetical protein